MLSPAMIYNRTVESETANTGLQDDITRRKVVKEGIEGRKRNLCNIIGEKLNSAHDNKRS